MPIRRMGRKKSRSNSTATTVSIQQFRDKIEEGQLKITGVDLDGEVRIVELSDHPFYVATLFLPQISSRPESPHPLIVAYLKAALAFQTSRRDSGIKM